MSRGGAPLCINVCELSEIDGNYYLVSSEGRLALYDGSLSFCDKVVKCVEQSDYTLTGTYNFSNSTTTFNHNAINIEANSYTPIGVWNFAGADVYGLDLGIFDCDDTKTCVEVGNFSLAGTWIFDSATLQGLGVLGCAGMVECVQDGAFMLEGLWDFSAANVSGMEPSTGPQTFGCNEVENCIEQGNFSLTGTYDFTNATVNGIFDCDVIKTCVEEGIVVTEADPGFENATVTFPTPIENKGESLRSMGFFTSEGVTNLYNINQPEELILYNVLDSAVLDIEDPKGIFFKPDGTRLYVLTDDTSNGGNASIFQFDLSTARDIDSSNITYINKFQITPASGTYSNIFFSDDGTRFYLTDRNEYDAFQYDLSTAWDITTATAAGTYDLRNIDSSFVAGDSIIIKDGGARMYVIRGANGRVYQYDLSTAWDITTGSYAGNEYIPDQNVIGFQRYTISMNDNGTKLYIFSGSGKKGSVHTLSTPRDISTASFDFEFYEYNNSFNNGINAGSGSFYHKIEEGTIYVIGKEDIGSQRPNIWKTDVGLSSEQTINYWYNIKENYNAIRFKLFIHDIKDGQGLAKKFKRTGLVSEGFAKKSDRTIADWGNNDNSNTEFFCTHYGQDGPETFNDRVLHTISEYEDGGTWYDLDFFVTMDDTTNVGQVGSVMINITAESPVNGVTDTDQVFTIVAEPYYDVGFEAVNYQ